MSIHTFAKAVRNARNRVQLNLNHALGRQFVPSHGSKFFIETSSICNLKCRFCAYEKKQSPRVTMEDGFFLDVVDQAVEMGLVNFHMTPCTGDVFMDKTLFNKLEAMDKRPGVASYDFFTNLTIPEPEDIDRLIGLKKMVSMTISVYGHDRETFVAITKSTGKIYDRLLRNIDHVLGRLPDLRLRLTVALRSTRDAWRRTSELLDRLSAFRRAGIRVRTSHVYSNWGGYITPEDVAGLDLDVIDTASTYKKGACTLLFTGIQVMATGIVNGCACRDVDATLRIGDLNEAPLRSILSTQNQAYMDLIREQEAGQFRPVCRSCDFYKSIYRATKKHRKRGGLKTLSQFMSTSDN